MVYVNFDLKDKRKESTPLIVYITNQSRMKYSPGIKIQTKHWDPQRKKVKRSHPNAIMINQAIRSIETTLESLYLEAMHKGEFLSNQKIKDHLNLSLGKQKDDSQDLIKFIEKVIHQREIGGKFKHNTIKQYWSSLKYIKQFAPLDFNDIDIDFFYRFVDGMKDRRQNTKWGFVKHLKLFLRLAHERGVSENEIYKNSEFTMKQERVRKFFYDEKTLAKLYQHNFTNKRLDSVRDMFIILCWTGLRISDLPKVHLRNIDGDNLVIQTTKTGGWVTIPMAHEVIAILHKHDYNLPLLSDQKFNKYLKEMAKEARLPNAAKLTSHVGRISFACNLWIAGVPDKLICEIGGWKNQRVYSRYLDGLTQNDHLKKLSQFWKDKKSVLKVI